MRSKRQSIVLALLLVVVTVALYYPIRRLPFINYDDDLYVTENLHVQSGLEWDTVQWAFVTNAASNWHPLTWLSHALDFQLFGLDPTGPHLINLLLHVCNVVLLFWVLLRATGFAGRSAMVAALFAVHPINVQSVAWIAERKNLLSMLFFLLALGAYRWYAREPRISRYLMVGVLFGLGLMAKPQVITLPFVLLLWDYWPLGRMFAEADRSAPCALSRDSSFSWLLWEKIPLFAISAASAVITLLAHRAGAVVAVVQGQVASTEGSESPAISATALLEQRSLSSRARRRREAVNHTVPDNPANSLKRSNPNGLKDELVRHLEQDSKMSQLRLWTAVS